MAGATDAPVTLRAGALNGAGVLAHYQYDLGRAGTLCGESLTLYRQLEDKPGIAAALNGLAVLVAVSLAVFRHHVVLTRRDGKPSEGAGRISVPRT